jgi:flavin reductase (DIM6/NTAB) family NADH-FMN oxidoreductase RutF
MVNNGTIEKVRGKPVSVPYLLARSSLEIHCIVFNCKQLSTYYSFFGKVSV